MKRHTFRVYFFIKKSRLNSEGLAPINIRITIDRREVSFTSGIPIDPSLWDTHAQRLSGRSKVAREVNSSLAKIQTYLLDLYHKIREHDGGVTSERLRDVFLGREKLCEQHTVLELFDKLICQKKLLAQNEVIKEVSANSYVCSKGKLVSYMQLYRKASDIDMKKIDYGFIDEFRTYLLTLGGCDHNTMIRHMRHLKQVTTDAYRNNYIDRDPFYDITLTVKKTERFFLSEEELVILKETEFKNKILEEVRDLFLFCCYTGLGYSDLKNLRYTDIVDNVVYVERIKTGNDCCIPLLKIPLEIIEKYKDDNRTDDHVFSVRACQRMNLYLKDIGTACGFRKVLTTHTARHSFATLMLTKGVSIESLSKMLGHTDLKTTQIYAKILNQKVIDEMKRVQENMDSQSKEEDDDGSKPSEVE